MDMDEEMDMGGDGEPPAQPEEEEEEAPIKLVRNYVRQVRQLLAAGGSAAERWAGERAHC